MTAAELRGLMDTLPHPFLPGHLLSLAERSSVNAVCDALNALPALLAVVEAAQLHADEVQAFIDRGGTFANARTHDTYEDMISALAPFAPTPGDAS